MTDKAQSTLIRILRMAVGCEEIAPIELSGDEWTKVYRQACRQTVIALIYGVVSRMDGGTRPPLKLMLELTGRAETIKGFNALMNAEAARLTKWFEQRGRRTAILKGQANARLYPHADERQPGDIDIWVEGGRKDIVKLLRDEGMMSKRTEVSYHHVHLPKNDKGISVEVHFRPSSGNMNPFSNRRLQQFLESEIRLSQPCPEGFCVPTAKFALLMQMSHIQRHFFTSGIGLRHIVDYYFLLTHSTDNDRAFTGKVLGKYGIDKVAAGVMWLMQELFSMDSQLLICQPDSRRGRWMLNEIFGGGNFGQYSPKGQQSTFTRILNMRLRTLKLYRFCFSECLWTDIKFWIEVTKSIPDRIRYRSLSLKHVHTDDN